MKPVLLIGAILFLILGLLLLFIAFIVWLVGRSRGSAAPVLGFGAMHGVGGALAGQVFPLTMYGFYVGRDPALAQVVINDTRVSKRHVWIGLRDGHAVAIDSGSTNGTYLNAIGPRIGEVRLSPGDTIIISDEVSRLRYER
jgi:hypothetical protein